MEGKVISRHVFVEHTPDGVYRRELTEEQNKVFESLKSGKEQRDYVHSLDKEGEE